jgi:hypothetical protein
MKKVYALAVAVCLVLGGCRGQASRSGHPGCLKIGDTIQRGEIGAAVPPRGQGVNAYGDGATSSASMDISTSQDGVVTITVAKDRVSTEPEVCVLP